MEGDFHFLALASRTSGMNLPSWKAVGLRTGGVFELVVGLKSLNVTVTCQFCALLSQFLAAYYLVTVVDSCFIHVTRFHFFYFDLFLFIFSFSTSHSFPC